MLKRVHVRSYSRSEEGLKAVVQQALEEAGQAQRGSLSLADFEAALSGADLSDMQARQPGALPSASTCISGLDACNLHRLWTCLIVQV